MKTHIYRVELLVIDHENMGEKEVRHQLENSKYLSPHVMALECRATEWEDSHPLNHYDTQQSAFRELFGLSDREGG